MTQISKLLFFEFETLGKRFLSPCFLTPGFFTKLRLPKREYYLVGLERCLDRERSPVRIQYIPHHSENPRPQDVGFSVSDRVECTRKHGEMKKQQTRKGLWVFVFYLQERVDSGSPREPKAREPSAVIGQALFKVRAKSPRTSWLLAAEGPPDLHRALGLYLQERV